MSLSILILVVPRKALRLQGAFLTPGLCALLLLPKPVAPLLVNSSQVRLNAGPAGPRSPGQSCPVVTQQGAVPGLCSSLCNCHPRLQTLPPSSEPGRQWRQSVP